MTDCPRDYCPGQIPGPASNLFAAADLLDDLDMSYTATDLVVIATYLNRKENPPHA